MQPIPASRVIYAIVPAGAGKGARVLFPIDKFLLNKRVVAVETFNSQQLTTSPNGQPIVTTTDANVITITLLRNSMEIHEGIPNNLLNTLSLFGLFKAIPPTIIDWNSSYVKVTNTLGAATSFVVPLIVHYIPD